MYKATFGSFKRNYIKNWLAEKRGKHKRISDKQGEFITRIIKKRPFVTFRRVKNELLTYKHEVNEKYLVDEAKVVQFDSGKEKPYVRRPHVNQQFNAKYTKKFMKHGCLQLML